TSGMEIPPSVKDGPLHPHIKYNYSKDPLSSAEMRTRYQQNNAMVTHMDERIGDILSALEESGEYDNTIIVFMSDQGINFGENGVAGKVCLYDVSVRAPLIITGPGLPQKTRVSERVYLQDIYPTLLELAGADIPDYMDFKSLNPLIIRQSEKSPHQSIYMAMFDDQRGIIYGDHKLILYPKAGAAELYELKSDPWEINDIFKEEGSAEILKQLGIQLTGWQQETGDTLDLRVVYPSIFGNN
ncbi:sulfatase/phosphatase domain-containing protein, partial [Bacteroidota bacterium]